MVTLRAPKRTEAEVAAAVMARMKAEGWDCYPEAMLPSGRADIVGVRPFPFMPQRKCVHIVECKTTWSLALLEQAIDRIAFAHYVSIAAPTNPGRFFERLCKERGIGMIRVRGAELYVDYDRCVEPRLFRRKQWRGGPQAVLDSLDEDMKRYAPGSTSADGYSTPWRRTMQRCERYIAENPGCTIQDILARVENHYATRSSARQGLLHWLSQREGIETREDGPVLRFYSSGAGAAEAVRR